MLDVREVHPVVARFSGQFPTELGRELLRERKAQLDEQKRNRPFRQRALDLVLDCLFGVFAAAYDAYARLRFAFARGEAREQWLPRPVPSAEWYQLLRDCEAPEEDLVRAFAHQFVLGWLEFLCNQAAKAFFEEQGRANLLLEKEDLLPPVIPNSDIREELQPLWHIQRMTQGVCGQDDMDRLLRGFARNIRRDLRGVDADFAYRNVILRSHAGNLYLVPTSA